MDMKKFLKYLLRNCWSEFGIISQSCFLCDPFQKCSRNIDPSQNMAAMGGGGGGAGFFHGVDFKFFKILLL